MKKINFILLLVCASFLVCCDPCKDVACGLNGTCNEGKCVCDDGAFGTNCELLKRDEFIDDWDAVSQSCSGGNVTGITKLLISDGDSINQIDITLLNFNVKTTAKLKGEKFVFGPVNGFIGSNPTIFSGDISKKSKDALFLELEMELTVQKTTIFCDVDFEN